MTWIVTWEAPRVSMRAFATRPEAEAFVHVLLDRKPDSRPILSPVDPDANRMV